MYYVYILYSRSTGRFYTGQTDDVGDRFIRHNQRRSKSTKSGAPWLVVHVEAFKTRSEAIRREMEIKAKKNRRYMIQITSFTILTWQIPQDIALNSLIVHHTLSPHFSFYRK